MIRHMCTSIEGLLSYSKTHRIGGLIQREDGTYYSHKEAVKALKERLAKGEKLLPSTGCVGFDPLTGCPGHPDEPDSETKTNL